MNTTYEAVTAHLVKALEGGVVPWRKSWVDASPPSNAVSNRPYRGINLFLLGLGMFRDHRWLSFKQAQQLRGHVRSGEKSMIAVFWKRLEVKRVDEVTGDVTDAEIPFLRFYHVFNVEQCDGLQLPALPTPNRATEVLRIERAEKLLETFPSPPKLRYGDSPWYQPDDDLIQIPPAESFHSTDAFYATLYHEYGHATGHETRLARKGVTGQIRFGSETYGQEELVAELTSAFCCSVAGLDNSLLYSSASYIQGWLKVLKGDPKMVVIAAAQAQKAADYIQGLPFEAA